ncbi:MAG: trypsin-like peptidase domain-containing protein [Okeania sp. SIO3C4]|nr:trypsin-like peptidase domain-containing protein [Okeania sp. SIO3C4]
MAEETVGSSSSNIEAGFIEELARLITVRIFTPNASGSGILVKQQETTYTILTNWHVLANSPQTTITAPDGQKYQLFVSQQLGSTDLAIAQFDSKTTYQIAKPTTKTISVGETVFAAGFPMYQGQNWQTTFSQGLQVFQLTQGVVSLILPKSLPQGYRLGYTNDILVGMSGGPIFNQQGELIGVNGRIKNRDPSFGVYVFEDGTEPSAALLEQMVNSSWGIPIATYLQSVPPD